MFAITFKGGTCMKKAAALSLALCLSLQSPVSALAQIQQPRDILKLQEQGPSDQKKESDLEREEETNDKEHAEAATPESGDAETENTGTEAETSGQEKPEIPEDTETPQEPESSENLEDSEVTESPEKPENSENPESPETPEDSEESKEPETPQDQPEDSETSGKEETEGETTVPEETEKQEQVEDQIPQGGMEELAEEETGSVQLKFHSILVKEHGIAAEILLYDKKDEDKNWTGSIHANARVVQTDPYETSVTVLDQLPAGDYVLEIRQEGYETYQQELQVEADKMTRVILVDDYLDIYYQADGSAHPGVFRLGDVNGDEKIDHEDEEALLDALQTQNEENVFADLNGDGAVDLVDLQYFTLFYENKKASDSSITYRADIKPDMLEDNLDNPSLEGDITTLFDGNEDTSVTLKPAKADEAVSEKNPMELNLAFKKPIKDIDGIVISQPKNVDNQITAGTIEIYGTDGKKPIYTLKIEDAENGMTRASASLFRSRQASSASVSKDANGDLVLNLGSQVAVKKISIKITATSGDSLADISNVEFLNGMENRIPEPEMNIPQGLTAEVGSREFLVSWKPEKNVTGYEVKICQGGEEETVKTEQNFLEVSSFKGKKLKNGTVYEVSVQSLNGDWKSGYSQPIQVTPMADEVPPAPENVRVTGAWKRLNVSWKDMEDTDYYTIYYRKKGDAGEYQSMTDIKGTSTVIRGLEETTEYELYLTGTNSIGTSKPSAISVGTTTNMLPPKTPNYKLINVPVEGEAVTDKIESIEFRSDGSISGVFDSEASTPLNQIPDEELDSHFEIVDGKYDTGWYLNDWDGGIAYPSDGIGKLPIVTFQETVEMDTMILIPEDEQPYDYIEATLFYWEDEDSEAKEAKGKLTKKRDSDNGKIYYEFQANDPFKAKKVQLNVRTTNQYRITAVEMKYYYYDSLEDDIFGLYQDDMHLTLKPEVTTKMIQDLRARLEEKDPVSGEYHPKKESLAAELDYAEDILNNKDLAGVLTVNNQVTKAADKHITFSGGLNAWQPLGVTAMAGDELVIYVGNPDKKLGDSASLRLIATQYHGESGTWHATVQNLKTGRNEITVPPISSMDVERGGQLYIEYTGARGKENYSVRVLGGSTIPTLDITTATESDARRTLVEEYVKNLEQYVPELEQNHDKIHQADGKTIAYDPQNCILGATDIVMKNMMFSVSAEQILAGLKGSTTEEKADQLYESLIAMENMVDLFYQSKGLSYDASAGATNQMPSSRLNIRYQRMFAGAFMYAGGLHIGIEWGSVAGLTNSTTVVADDNGKYQSGRYFGWGIAHEIGHIINESAYAMAEVTNNYFALLAQAEDTNDSVRFLYDDVYDKVTSGVTGPSSDVFTQLGLYWQLHLAYDRGGFNFKKFDTYEEQFDNLIFARMDTYARNPGGYPELTAPKGVTLTLDGDRDNNLMRLACAGAQKNLLEFFDRWGMIPDEKTKKYAAQFEKEDRAIWFVNDEARVYAMEEGSGSIAAKTTVSATLAYKTGTNEVVIENITSNASDTDAMLGYEIYRTEWIKDKQVRRPVGFIMAEKDSFTDFVTTVNNRAYTYEVVGYDKYLNATEALVLDPVKISHKGVMGSENWTVTTNLEQKPGGEFGGEDPETPVKKDSDVVIDGKTDTTYTTSYPASGTADIMINLNAVETVSGLTYTYTKGTDTVPVKDYTISVSLDGKNWTEVKKGTFDGKEEGTWQVMFDKEGDDSFYAYEASYVKLSARGSGTFSISELGLLGQSGDNVELLSDGIGYLKDDYILDQHSGDKIPKGSLIFTGKYAGNPAYNVVLLYDENGNIVGGVDQEGNVRAEQVIFAEVPEHGNLGNVSEGIWVYYITPDHLTDYKLPASVRAELYRVNNAETNEGERLVSNTVPLKVPEQLPDISLKSDSVQAYRP